MASARYGHEHPAKENAWDFLFGIFFATIEQVSLP
jgi:hypothetical protein